MKILTLNTWNNQGPWKERWELIFKGLQELRPDIVAFQEVFDRSWAEEVQRRSGYKHLVFPREPGGLMLLSHYRVEASECMTMVTQASSEEYKRYALYAKFAAGTQTISFFNTHLSWQLHEGKTREAQVGELLKFIKRCAGAGQGPIFVTGDFNAPPDTTEIRTMMLEGGFIDLFGTLFPKISGLTWDNQNKFAAGSSVPLPDRRIDYIFMRGVSITKVGAVEVVLDKPSNGIYASDHFGVLTEVNL